MASKYGQMASKMASGKRAVCASCWNFWSCLALSNKERRQRICHCQSQQVLCFLLFPFRPPVISVLLRRHSIECLKFAAKISHIFKACCLSYNENAVFSFRKKLGSTLQTIFQSIINGRCMQIAFKNIQHTAFAYRNRSCKVFQGYPTIIVFVDMLHHYLQLCLCLCGGFVYVLSVVPTYAFVNLPP